MEIKSGPFKGKKITFASTAKIEELKEFADDFMFQIFDFEAGEYVVSDESSLLDFTELNSSDLTPIWEKIEEHYNVKASQISSDKLVDILCEIKGRRNPH